MEAVQPADLGMTRPVHAGFESTKLVDALLAGDRSAAEEIVDETYALVYASVFRLCGDSDLAADLTQETYARAWRSLSQFQRRCRFSTWLYRIAYTTFLNHVRKPQRLQPFDENVTEQMSDPGRGPDEEVEERLDGGRLRRAVLDLPEELRYTVSARYWGEVPVREIARTEGITTVAIRKRLRRAMQHLRLALEEAS